MQARDGGVTKTNFASFLRAATEKAKVVAGKNAEDFWVRPLRVSCGAPAGILCFFFCVFFFHLL